MKIKNALYILLFAMAGQSLFAEDFTQLKCAELFTPSLYLQSNINLPFSSNEELQSQIARAGVAKSVSEDPRSSGFDLVNISVEADQKYRTLRMFHAIEGRIPKGAEARFLIIHGNGSSRSRAFTMGTILRIMVEGSGPGSSKTIRKIRSNPNDVKIAAEAIDLPGCGNGPDLKDFDTLDKTTDWLASYVQEMKMQTPDLPIFIFTRSSSAALGVSVAKKYPGLVKGFILMSPTMPGDAELIKHGTEVMYELQARKLFEINEPGLKWIDKMLNSVKWSPDYFNNITAKILTGDFDPQMVDQERNMYARIAEANKNVIYTQYPADHNVVDTTPRYRNVGQGAYLDIFAFIRQVLDGKPIK